MTIYDFSARLSSGEEHRLADYRGKVLLVVNVASKCGFTPQYKGLQAVYAQFGPRGFEILAFPALLMKPKKSKHDIRPYAQLLRWQIDKP
jgi:glutathione peroxidase-family protein